MVTLDKANALDLRLVTTIWSTTVPFDRDLELGLGCVNPRIAIEPEDPLDAVELTTGTSATVKTYQVPLAEVVNPPEYVFAVGTLKSVVTPSQGPGSRSRTANPPVDVRRALPWLRPYITSVSFGLCAMMLPLVNVVLVPVFPIALSSIDGPYSTICRSKEVVLATVDTVTVLLPPLILVAR